MPRMTHSYLEVSIDMHTSLPRCYLNRRADGHDDCASELEFSLDYDYLVPTATVDLGGVDTVVFGESEGTVRMRVGHSITRSFSARSGRGPEVLDSYMFLPFQSHRRLAGTAGILLM